MRFPSPLLRGTSWSRKSPGGRDNVPLIFCRSDANSCLTVCNPINYSTPGVPVLHCLPELLKLMSIELRCHPTTLSTVIPFSSHLQSFPASGSFPFPSAKYVSFSYSESLPVLDTVKPLRFCCCCYCFSRLVISDSIVTPWTIAWQTCHSNQCGTNNDEHYFMYLLALYIKCICFKSVQIFCCF